MKKIIALLSATTLTIALLSGCTGGANSSTKESSDKIKIYTSFYPMYDFAKRIGGDKVELTNLVPAGTEPHDWEPSTTDIRNLEGADMLIYTGAGMEHWVDKVVDSLENKDLVTVEASENITLIEGNHTDEDASEEEEASAYDPHVWMSIKNAKVEMETIKNALVKLDNSNAEYYEENYKTNAAKFDDLDKVFTDTLSVLTNKDIIVAHDAFAYLCADYGLNQVPIEGLSADSEPDPAKMSEIIDFAKEHKVKTIFFEELVSPKVAETIANELGAKTDMLNPLEGLTNEQISAGEDYLSVMTDNLTALEKALK